MQIRLPNNKKICFITAVNNDEKYAKCLAALQKLVVPDGMSVDYLAVRGAHSMTEAYQQGMKASDAKYKVYIHQDVICVNKQMIKKLIKCFCEYPEYGLLGVVGTEYLPDNAIWWECSPDKFLGMIADNHYDLTMKVYSYRVSKRKPLLAAALDGVFLATQYDVDWRYDLPFGWDFYDISQSMEFWRHNYKVGVVPQEFVWCQHWCGQNPLKTYDNARKRFLKEYFWGNKFSERKPDMYEQSLTSIVLLSYNTVQLTRQCIESIRRYTEPGKYEIIVVDNASTDGSVEYLKCQSEIKCVFNTENKGFPKGCNQGIDIAQGTEILLLNSDTVVTPRWLDQLKLALYSSEKMGAVSCVTNNCSNWQQIQVDYSSIEEMIYFADRYNCIDEEKWIPYFRLVAFCMLIKRNIADQIGGLDEAFSPGNYEDDDYSMRIRQAGYQMVLCKDTFIHHYGSASFKKSCSQQEREEKQKRYAALLNKNLRYFCHKWQVTEGYSDVDIIVTSKLPETVRDGARIININCHNGSNLFRINEKYRNVEVFGVALSEHEAEIANFDGTFLVKYVEDVTQNMMDYLSGQYTMIIVPQIQTLVTDIEQYLMCLLRYIEDDGAIYFSIGDNNYVVKGKNNF